MKAQKKKKKMQLPFSRSGVEPEILLFWQTPRWFWYCWFWETVPVLKLRGQRVSHCDHPAASPEILPPLHPQSQGLWLVPGAIGDAEAMEGVSPEFFPYPPGMTCTEGQPGPSALCRESTLPDSGSHPNGLSAWGRTQALLTCSAYLSSWK